MNRRITNGFGMVSNTVLRDPDISLGEKALYSYLSTYADKNNELFVSVTKIADECGIGYSTALRHLKNLEKIGVISRKSRGFNQSKTISLLK
jgi:DNA-binding MarR family transcriptional regulator